MNERRASNVLRQDEQPSVRVLRLNRPEARNALNVALRHELLEELREADADPLVRAIILCGDDKAFAAGADIREMAEASVVEIAERNIEGFWASVSAVRKPMIAAVQGLALGAGFELALACDIIVAGQGASFGLPEVGLGIMPGGGGTQRLPRLAGKQVALRYMLTGDRMDAARAWQLGIVTDCVADDEVMNTALRLAGRLVELSPLAIDRIKQATLRGLDSPLDAGIQLERQSYYFLNATDDRREGIAAFLEKRKPNFTGR